MVDILHEVAIKGSSPRAAYEALTRRQGLADWWTQDTRGDSAVGGFIEFHFQAGSFTMKVLELTPEKRVLWEVVAGPEEWVGTKVMFDIASEGSFTLVRFKHEGWKEPVPFMHHCSTKWGLFLVSLKSLLETGKGAPHPNDVKIAAWE
jgi:uncharacterized protein YndB with AHSA1/START domain